MEEGSKSTTTEDSYTMSGTGESIGVAGVGGITVEGTGFRGHGIITFSASPSFSAPSPLQVTTEQDIPKAYECAHENCEVALPNKHHHRVTCKEKVYFALGSVVKVDCNHKYYKCQTSTCGNDGKHLITHACGHEDEKEDAWKHEMETSCSSSTTQNGSTVYCQSTNFYLCQHENHEWPPTSSPPQGSNPPSPSPSDNTPNCSGCTSHCSSPCSCSDSGTCNGTVADPPPPEPTTILCLVASTTSCTIRSSDGKSCLVPTCSSGCGSHYWTCYPDATYDHETPFTCSRCGTSFTRCTNGTCTHNGQTYMYHWDRTQ